MLEIMIDLSSYVVVPAALAVEQRVIPALTGHSTAGSPHPLIRILSDANLPQDAFFAVRYRNHWFWIDDRDLYSKRTFSFLMFLFTLTESGGTSAAHVVTVPTR
jgi:hypothetical protein